MLLNKEQISLYGLTPKPYINLKNKNNDNEDAKGYWISDFLNIYYAY